MQIKSLVLFSCLWVLFSPLCGYAQSIPVFYTPDIEIDGKKEDWSAHEQIASFTQKNPVVSDANAIEIYAGWNELYLFILIDVKDKRLLVLKEDSSALYLNDAVEVYIDPLSDSKNTMDINDYQFIVDVRGKAAILKGDNRQIDSGDFLAPKQLGLATMVFKSSVSISGIINDAGKDEGYTVEMAIPFAAIAIDPKEGITCKMDFCIDDADSLVDVGPIPDTAEVPGLFYSSWRGNRDFSFPGEWTSFQLKGKPSVARVFFSEHTRKLVMGVLFFLLLMVSVIIYQFYRIRRLKNVPQKSQLPQFGQIESYILEPPFPEENIIYDHEPGLVVNTIEKEPGDEPSTSSEEPEVIKKARIFIKNNIENEIDIDELASFSAVSTRQLQRIFKDHLQITPSNFIVIFKMEEAKKLLTSGHYNVSEVAYHLGYSDAAYFTRVFKKYFGFPPRELLG